MGVRPDVEIIQLNSSPVTYHHEMHGQFTWAEQAFLSAFNRKRDDGYQWRTDTGLYGFTNLHDFYITSKGTTVVTDMSAGGSTLYGSGELVDQMLGRMAELNIDPDTFRVGPGKNYVVGKHRYGEDNPNDVITYILGEYASPYNLIDRGTHLGGDIEKGTITRYSPSHWWVESLAIDAYSAYEGAVGAFGALSYDWREFIGGYHIHSFGNGVPHQHFLTYADYTAAAAAGRPVGEVDIIHEFRYSGRTLNFKSFADFDPFYANGGAGIIGNGIFEGYPHEFLLDTNLVEGYNTPPIHWAARVKDLAPGRGSVVYQDGIGNLISTLTLSDGTSTLPKILGNLGAITGGGAQMVGDLLSMVVFIGSDVFDIRDADPFHDPLAPKINADGTIAPPVDLTSVRSATAESRKVSHW